MKQFNRHTKQVNCVGFHPDGKSIISGSDDKVIRIWDIESGRTINKLTWHTNYVKTVCFSPCGNSIASGGDDKKLRIGSRPHCYRESQSLLTAPEGTHYIRSLSFSPDSKTIACASDSRLRIYNTKTLECLTLVGHTGTINCASFSPDGKRIVSCSSDYEIRIWEHRNDSWREVNNKIGILGNRLNILNCLSLSLDGHCVLVFGNQFVILNPDFLFERQFIDQSKVNSVSFSPNGKLFAAGSEDGMIRIWDYENGECIKALNAHCGKVNSVSFSPDGLTLASGFQNGNICIWDIE